MEGHGICSLTRAPGDSVAVISDLILRDTGLDYTPQEEGMGSDLFAAILTAPDTVLMYTAINIC